MDMTGEYRIAAPRDAVWAALNDVDVLEVCIPGCEEIHQDSPTTMTAKVVQKIGPVKARFEGQGGVAGFAKGSADVTLEEDGEETVLRYEARAQVGGKLARLGSRLIDATAKKVATQFFNNFQQHLNDPDPPEDG